MLEFTVVMIGKTGNGKSALGNVILERHGKDIAFKTSFMGTAGTQNSQKESAKVNQVQFHVIDTPGVMDPERSEKMVLTEIHNCSVLSPDGINALLLVTKCGQTFTKEEEGAIRALEVLFGKQLFEYGIIIFTHGDQFEAARRRGEVKSTGHYLESMPPNIKRLFDKFKGRHVFFNNNATGEEAREEANRQRNKLVKHIRAIMTTNKEPYKMSSKINIEDSYTASLLRMLGECFPATSTVLIDGKHHSKMASLQIGTKVVSVGQDDIARAQLDTVYFFSHAAEDVLAPFIRITTAGGKTLHLSEGHYIYVGKDALKTGALFTAREVKVGDVVHVVDALDQAPRAEEVIEVKTELKRGLYCPHTLGGSLVVDGVCVSTYTEMFPPRVAHGLLWPVRVLYRMAPNLAAKIAQPQGDQGMPKWLGWLYDYVA